MAFHKAKQRATINKESLKMLVPMLTYIFFLSYWWKKSFQCCRKSGKQERRRKKEREKNGKRKTEGKEGKRKENCIPQGKANSNTQQGITEYTCADVDIYCLPILLV